MKISNLVLGPLRNNCYFLEKDNNVIIIDPTKNAELLISTIGTKKLVAIFITHYHFDHIGALAELKEKYDVEIYDYKKYEGNYKVDNFDFDLIYTKGHSNDSVSFYFKETNSLFCGDFIFRKNIGRCDLESGDYNVMLESIEKIKQYDDFDIYPGHGEKTSLLYEKEYNPYF